MDHEGWRLMTKDFARMYRGLGRDSGEDVSYRTLFASRSDWDRVWVSDDLYVVAYRNE